MTKPIERIHYWLGGLIALLLVIVAGAGVVNTQLYTPFLDETLVAFQFFQDLLALFFAPCLVALMLMAHRGSRRAFVLWAGILVFVAYYYAFYGFGYVLTVYYPLYLALMGLSIYSLVGLLVSIDRVEFRAAVRAEMPVRLGSVVLGITALFVPIWMSMIVQRMASHEVETTDLVFVLDLAYLIPACVYAAVQLWRRTAVGYLLSGPLLFKAMISGILLTGGELLKVSRGFPLAVDQLLIYLFLAGIGLVALLRYLWAIDDQRLPAPENVMARIQ